MDERWYYTTITVQRQKIDQVLNNLEQLASGMYEIVSIVPELHHNSVVMVVIRLRVVDEEVVFDEQEIKRRLGFGVEE